MTGIKENGTQGAKGVMHMTARRDKTGKRKRRVRKFEPCKEPDGTLLVNPVQWGFGEKGGPRRHHNVTSSEAGDQKKREESSRKRNVPG